MILGAVGQREASSSGNLRSWMVCSFPFFPEGPGGPWERVRGGSWRQGESPSSAHWGSWRLNYCVWRWGNLMACECCLYVFTTTGFVSFLFFASLVAVLGSYITLCYNYRLILMQLYTFWGWFKAFGFIFHTFCLLFQKIFRYIFSRSTSWRTYF